MFCCSAAALSVTSLDSVALVDADVTRWSALSVTHAWAWIMLLLLGDVLPSAEALDGRQSVLIIEEADD